MSLMCTASTLCLSLVVSACNPAPAGGAADHEERGAKPQDAEKAVLAAFTKYDVVAGFNASHGNQDTDEFLLDLIRNPALPRTVDDIAIECGNALYQGVLDRYVAGDDVPLAEVRKVWRDTTQPECGFSTFIEQLVPLVRRINADRPAGQQLRVLAVDPAIDWSRVTSREDLGPVSDRNASITRVMEKEVLAKHHKALLLMGVNHVRHLPGTAVAQYEADGYDGRTYVVDDHHGFGNQDPELSKDNDRLEARMARWPVPSLTPVKGSWLAKLDPGYFTDTAGEVPDGITGPPGVDAYLYVGPRDGLLRERRSAQAMLDQAYLAELRRRAQVIGAPPDSPRNPDVMLRNEAEEGDFIFDPSQQRPGGGGDGPPASGEPEGGARAGGDGNRVGSAGGAASTG